jgi:outer membrane receptor protein involved in Fe transport
LTFASVVGPVSAATTPVVIEQAQQQGVLAGTVTDSRNSPLSGATITVEGPGGSRSTTTDGKGQFSISLAPALYTLSISKGGYQSFRSDEFTVAAGSTTRATYPLTEATTSTLRVIGSTGSRRAGVQPINRDITPNQVIGADELQLNQTPNLNNEIEELPGVTLQQGNRSTLSYYSIRGADIEARTEIDGHPLSAGVSGLYYTGLLNPGIFQSVEIEKGTGVSSAGSGQSTFGTVNLQTWGFTDNKFGFVESGVDSFNGQFTKILYSNSFLKDKRLSIVADYNVTGYNGPAYGYNGPLELYGGGSYSSTLFQPAQKPGTAVIDFLGPFNAAQRLTSETFKARWRFNDTTSLWAGYVGAQAFVNPEGSAYGYNLGSYKITPCVTGATFAACSAGATYGNPSTFGYIGQTIPLYTAYPGETQTENNPLFEAEFRTAFKDNTILVRPFTQVIQRINDGSNNPNELGSNGGFSLVTAPGGTCTAVQPCYQYTGNGTAVNTYTSATNPCPAGPAATIYSCYIPTGGNAVPYLQYEIDRLHGVTATVLHPIKNGTLRFSYEYSSDSSFDLSGNAPTITAPYSIPGLSVPAGTPSISSVSNLSIPSALLRSNDFSVGLNVNPTERLLIGAALYYNLEQLTFQYLDPTVQSYASTVPGGLSSLPALFDTGTVQKEHLDPHLGIAYSLGRTASVRASFGSSVTLPYAKLVSGLPSLTTTPSANYPLGSITEKNPNLAPETSVGYDVGFDWRVLPGGGVLKVDGYSDVIYDKFLTQGIVYPTTPAIVTTQNAADFRSYGIELAAQKTTPGWGYNAELTLQRAFYYNLGPSYFNNLLGTYVEIYDNRQLDANPYSTGFLGLTYLGGTGGPDAIRGEFGVRYIGPNNSYYLPAYKTFYGTLRIPTVVKRMNLIISFRNIGGYQDAAGIAKASVFGTGMSTNSCTFVPSAANPSQYVTSACKPYTNGVQQVEPRTANLALQYRL